MRRGEWRMSERRTECEWIDRMKMRRRLGSDRAREVMPEIGVYCVNHKTLVILSLFLCGGGSGSLLLRSHFGDCHPAATHTAARTTVIALVSTDMNACVGCVCVWLPTDPLQ